MLRIRHILHPTDYSESSTAAFQMAVTLAHDYGARLTVLNVATPPPVMVAGELPVMPPVDNREYLNELLAKLRNIKTGYADVVIDRKLVEGDAATEILAMADTVEADLIVMGTHGRTGLSRLLMGSVAEQVLRKAHVPVLLTKAAKVAKAAPAAAVTQPTAATSTEEKPVVPVGPW